MSADVDNHGHSAVRLSFLLDFAKRVPRHYTTADVVTRIVVPETKDSKVRFIDQLASTQVGSPNYFVSH
eukprot:gene12951-5990_t